MLTLTKAPIFNKRCRMVPAVALASSVPCKANVRSLWKSNKAKALSPQSQLIAGQPMAAGAIGLQVQILLLNLVFHVTACTVKVFITLLGAEAISALLLLELVLKILGRQVGYDKTRVVFVL